MCCSLYAISTSPILHPFGLTHPLVISFFVGVVSVVHGVDVVGDAGQKHARHADVVQATRIQMTMTMMIMTLEVMMAQVRCFFPFDSSFPLFC
jgi:hypothetical protein